MTFRIGRRVHDSGQNANFIAGVLFRGRRLRVPPAFCMATIHPFPALLPKPDLARYVCELPYDVMSSEEARELARGNSLSFLHVSKPEIDLPPGTNVYDPAVYDQGHANFQRLIADGTLFRDREPHFYLYRQIMGNHAQIGIVAAASCKEYLDGTIKKHEFTRPDKEDDRVRHIEALDSQTGPVFLTYRERPDVNALVERILTTSPLVDFTAADGVRHTSWRVSLAADAQNMARIFQSIESLYIADGHHRSAAAARVFNARAGSGASGGFLAVIFPHTQMRILPYNRLLKDLNGTSADALLRSLEEVFTIQTPGAASPSQKHDLGFFLENQWHTLRFRSHFTEGQDAMSGLDVSLLQQHVLAPIFGINDPRTSDRIQFVGGIRGTGELETRVRSGEFACAFSMFPTRIEDLMAIADAGGIMPPKSTWFEPKLRDAMFCLMLDRPTATA